MFQSSIAGKAHETALSIAANPKTFFSATLLKGSLFGLSIGAYAAYRAAHAKPAQTSGSSFETADATSNSLAADTVTRKSLIATGAEALAVDVTGAVAVGGLLYGGATYYANRAESKPGTLREIGETLLR